MYAYCVDCAMCQLYVVCMCCQVRSGAGKVRDKQSESSAGYLSDGHVSSRSSDNESGSVCSEMVGRAVNTAGTSAACCVFFSFAFPTKPTKCFY